MRRLSCARAAGLAALVWIACGAGVAAAQDAGQDAVPLVATRVETLAPELDGGTGGVAVAASGEIYVADFGAVLSGPREETKVFRVAPDGSSAEVFATGLRGSSGNTFGPDGYLYQSSIGGNAVFRIAPDGAVTEFVREGIVSPVGIVGAPDGSFYVANCGSHSVRRIGPDGSSTELASGRPPFRCPNGITMDGAGNLYVANFGNGDVVKVTPDGEASVLATLPGGNNGHLIHHRGYLYVVDRGGHRIYRVSLSGETALLAGSGEPGPADGPPLEARFNYPNDIGVSPDGRWLYVNDVAVESEGQVLAPMVVRRIAVEPAG